MTGKRTRFGLAAATACGLLTAISAHAVAENDGHHHHHHHWRHHHHDAAQPVGTQQGGTNANQQHNTPGAQTSK